MTFLLILVIVVLALQVGLFFYIRKTRKLPEKSVLGKYDIHTARDAWNLINDPAVPDSDKEQIEVYYRGLLGN